MRSFFIIFTVFASFLILASCKNTKNQDRPPVSDAEIDINVLTENLSHPWELVYGSDNKIWMTERGGKVSWIDPVTGSVNLVANLTEVVSRGEGGLLGMALHPDFVNTPEVFLAYNYLKGGVYTEKVVKYRYNGTSLINPSILIDNIEANTFHNGCRLLISNDNKLFISTGDAGDKPLAQNMNSVNGKILRLNLDGSIPADNPFPGSPVWSLGHRNAQGLVFGNNVLYSSEHGPNADDEINIISKGKNYGWPNVEGFCNENAEKDFCQANQVVEPLKSWTPTIAVSGIDFYTQDYIPQFKNSVLMTTLKDNTLYQLKMNAAGSSVESMTEIFRGTYGRLRDVCIAPDGKVYVSTSNGSNDKILVISKKN
ncbi:PQQ-dependent sugar dehydrogenase [Daejeonella oryzae]|uniref:PQQ-dependent sugar dehydrogenase n=1 Tax=Daejeonella oryzae TaxID=1122943 RepID=UPI00047BA9E5|nr:PQQ-dependent sugar dehydrogenase [Daejeonella oryzae]